MADDLPRDLFRFDQDGGLEAVAHRPPVEGRHPHAGHAAVDRDHAVRDPPLRHEDPDPGGHQGDRGGEGVPFLIDAGAFPRDHHLDLRARQGSELQYRMDVLVRHQIRKGEVQRLSRGLHQPLIGQQSGMRAGVRAGGDGSDGASARLRRRRGKLPPTPGGEGPVGQEAGLRFRGGDAFDTDQGRVPRVCDAPVDADQRAAAPVAERDGRQGQRTPVKRCDLGPGRAETTAFRHPAACQDPHVGPLGRFGAQDVYDSPHPVQRMQLRMYGTGGGQVR